MARYIKANPKVAQFLRVENDRNQVKDGNYLLWQADILPLGRLTDLPQILEQIGGIALMAHEARQEQDGTVLRELPTATDPRFVVEKDETTAESEESSEVAEEPAEQPTDGAAEQPTDGAAESEESSEATEEPAEPAGGETAAAESETPNTETV